MKYNEKVKVLGANSKRYNVEGNEGVSHRARFMVEDEIFSVKVKEAEVPFYEGFKGKTGTLDFDFTSPKENLSVSVSNFKED